MEEKNNSVFNLSFLSTGDGTPHQGKELKMAIGFSPVTELALSFKDMSASSGSSYEETPVRKLCLNDTNTPPSTGLRRTKSSTFGNNDGDGELGELKGSSFQRTKSMPVNPSSSFLHAPSPLNTTAEDSDSSKKHSDEEYSPPRFPALDDSSESQSSPEQLPSSSALPMDDGESRDSGISENFQITSSASFIPSYPFKQLDSRKPFSDRTNFRRSTSTPLSSLTNRFKSRSLSVTSADKTSCQNSPARTEQMDDGFVDLMEQQNAMLTSFEMSASEGIQELMNSSQLPLPHSVHDKENTPCSRFERCSTRRIPYKRYKTFDVNRPLPKLPIASKRESEGQMSESKRRKSITEESPKKTFQRKTPPFILHRSLSEPECNLLCKALDNEQHLVGDYTRPPTLPIVPGKHQLKSVSCETVAKLVNGDLGDIKYDIIDCRYPYEYDGGHINGSLNLFLRQQIQAELFDRILSGDMSEKVLIFHCEFSSERGPKLAKHTREMDRSQNHYPRLHYPEIYIMDGGYKEFYEVAKDLCLPRSYVPMLHPDRSDDLKYFRARAKSENDDKEFAKKSKRGGLKRQKSSCRKLIS